MLEETWLERWRERGGRRGVGSGKVVLHVAGLDHALITSTACRCGGFTSWRKTQLRLKNSSGTCFQCSVEPCLVCDSSDACFGTHRSWSYVGS